VTDSTEDGALSISTMVGGSLTEVARIGSAGVATGTIAVQVFTESGTYNKTAGVKMARVRVVGPGGGGGGGATSATGGGGGAGGYSEKVIAAASLGETETVTVGTGGAGGSAAGNG